MDSHTSQIPPQSAADALGLMHAALDYFTGADLHALGAGQTLTVTSPAGKTVYRSHAPPARPAA
jgi:hypothetical protein